MRAQMYDGLPANLQQQLHIRLRLLSSLLPPYGEALSVGSACSGSETMLPSLERLLDVVGEARSQTPLRVDHRFRCENEDFKQEWIEKKNFAPPHILRDIGELG